MSIERLAGAKDKYAATLANELIRDFQFATNYPPQEQEVLSSFELTEVVNELSARLQEERERANQTKED